MIGDFLKKLFGTKNAREVRRLARAVGAINALEPKMMALSDAELAELTPMLRKRLADGAALDSLLPEAFAAVREAARRSMNKRHYDVQLMGGRVMQLPS